MKDPNKDACRWFRQSEDDYRFVNPNGIPGGSPFQVYDKDDLEKAFKDLKKIVDICRQFLENRGVFLFKSIK